MADPKLDDLVARAAAAASVDPLAHMREMIRAVGVVKVAAGRGDGGGPIHVPAAHRADPFALVNAPVVVAPSNRSQGGQIALPTRTSAGYTFGINATVSQPGAIGLPGFGRADTLPGSLEVHTIGILRESPNPADSARWVLDHIARQDPVQRFGIPRQQPVSAHLRSWIPASQVWADGMIIDQEAVRLFRVVPEGPLDPKDWPDGAPPPKKKKDEPGIEDVYKIHDATRAFLQVQRITHKVTIECVDDGRAVCTYEEEFWEAFRADAGKSVYDLHYSVPGAYVAWMSATASVLDLKSGETVNTVNKCYKVIDEMVADQYAGQVSDDAEWKEALGGGQSVKGLGFGDSAPIDRFKYPTRDSDGKVVGSAEHKRPADGRTSGKVTGFDEKSKTTVTHKATYYFSWEENGCPKGKQDEPEKDPTYK